MAECSFCGKEFDNKKELHRHWDEHEDEINSHQKDKMKKAKRQHEERKEQKMAKRKAYAGYGLAAVLLLGLLGVVGAQLINSPSGPSGPSQTLNTANDPVIGDESANVTIVEFGDYRCPVCKQFHESIYPRLKEDYIDTGKAKFKFVNYAFLDSGFSGDTSETAAVSGECVYNQDKEQFWDFHDSVYSNQGRESNDWATHDAMMSLARENTEGLNYDQLSTCIRDRQTLNEVRDDKSVGDQAGVSGTPTLYVNGKKVPRWSDYTAFSNQIDDALDDN